MSRHLFPIAALLLGSAFLFLAGGLHGLILPVRGTLEGFSPIELGFLGSGWATGFVAGCLLVPTIVRRVGHVRSYSSMAALAAISILLTVLMIDPLVWIALRALAGFCFAGAAMIVESWLNERATSDIRGRIFSVYMMTNLVGSTAGQMVIATGDPSSDAIFIIGAVFYCLAVLPTALSTAASPRPLQRSRLDLKRLYRASPVAAVAAFMIGAANGAFGTLGPVYAQAMNLPIAYVAYFAAAAVLGGAAGQIPLGRLSDRLDRRHVLAGTAATAALLGLFLAFQTTLAPVLAVVLGALFGMVLHPQYAVTVAHANDMSSDGDFVRISGGLLLIMGAGTMFGPLGAAQAMEMMGPGGLFAFTASVHLTIAAYAIYRSRRTASPPAETRTAFRSGQVVKQPTPESVALDPRAEGRTEDR